ncbi:MAG: hypothetical protein M1814_004600 [Vezdaea aestivalis]|nr:MAG: hypothetical protein M1814_004600 [Vezdaea aestivalis]
MASLSLSLTTLAAVSSLLLSVSASDNPLNIYYDAAPSPQEGPPFSRHASRDPSLVPIQASAIAGAYFITVLCLATCYMSFGRRLRRAAQSSKTSLEVEMVRPAIPKGIDPSPCSPESKTDMWPSPALAKQTNLQAPNFSYPSPVKASFPASTFNDRVVEADREAQAKDLERLYAAAYDFEDKNQSTISVQVRQTLSHTPQRSLESFQSFGPNAGRPVVPPPTYLQTAIPPAPQPPTSPAPSLPSSPSPHKQLKTHSRKTSATSLASVASKRRGVRGLHISSPIPTPDASHTTFTDIPDSEPLTPRYPPPPAAPRSRPTPPPMNRTPSLGRPNNLPASPRPLGPHTVDSKLSHARSTNASANNLPLRAMAGASDVWTSKEAGMTRTELSLPDRRLAALRSPGTAGAVPQTPYSAYMPGTPCTPITPRLVTRKDRKMRQKEEGRSVVKETVMEEDELWDSGYK